MALCCGGTPGNLCRRNVAKIGAAWICTISPAYIGGEEEAKIPSSSPHGSAWL